MPLNIRKLIQATILSVGTILNLSHPPSLYADEALFEAGTAADTAYKMKNYKLAYILMRKLAKQGDARANYNLAFMLKNGLGTEVDIPQAILYYQYAAANGLADASYNLGMMY